MRKKNLKEYPTLGNGYSLVHVIDAETKKAANPPAGTWGLQLFMRYLEKVQPKGDRTIGLVGIAHPTSAGRSADGSSVLVGMAALRLPDVHADRSINFLLVGRPPYDCFREAKASLVVAFPSVSLGTRSSCDSYCPGDSTVPASVAHCGGRATRLFSAGRLMPYFSIR